MKKVLSTLDPVFTWAIHPYQLYEYGLSIGLSPKAMLDGTALDEHLINDFSLHINWQQYRAMSLNFERHGPCDWCHRFGTRLSIASHGLFSLLALNCTTWREGIEDIKNYSVLINPIFYVELDEVGDYVYITIHPEFTRDPILNQHFEGYITTLYQAIFQLGATDLEAITDGIEIKFKEPTSNNKSTLSNFFNGGVEWGYYCNQIRVKKTLIDREIKNANPIYASQTRRQLQAQLSQLPAQRGILRELRQLFKARQFNLEQCSKALCTSTPTLKRLLKESRTSFSKELTGYRIENACWSAIHSNTSIQDLAEELGFQDINSFARLFKKELSIPFKEYRDIHQALSFKAHIEQPEQSS